jgi:hypothetical protein
MTPLELKKLKAELLNVQAAKAMLELRIDERLEEISRIQENIKISEAKELELIQRIESK